MPKAVIEAVAVIGLAGFMLPPLVGAGALFFVVAGSRQLSRPD